MAALGPGEEAEKAQADFVRSAVRDVRYGPESLREFTQWRVRALPLCWGSASLVLTTLEVSGHEGWVATGSVRHSFF